MTLALKGKRTAMSFPFSKRVKAILLVQQRFDIGRELADQWLLMHRRAVTLSGNRAAMHEAAMRHRMSAKTPALLRRKETICARPAVQDCFSGLALA